MLQSNAKLFYGLIVGAIGLICVYQFLTKSDQEEWAKKQVIVYQKEDIEQLMKQVVLFGKKDMLELMQNKMTSRITTKQVKYDYQRLYPNFMNCRKNGTKKWSLSTRNPVVKDYTKAAPNETHNERFIRGETIKSDLI